MSSKKPTPFGLHSLSAFLVLGVLLMTATVVYLDWNTAQSIWLSQRSLQKLQALNSEHQMVLDSLLEEDQYLQADLFQTNSLDLGMVEEKNHQGLLVTLETEESDEAFLTLQPAHPLSEERLTDLAEIYESKIPEFKSVEVDQNVLLEGEPHYWVLPDDYVKLADEVFPEVEEELESAPVTVAVIDSGVDSNHEAFTNTSLLPGWNTIEDNRLTYDDVGHGTHIAGILAAETQNVSIIPYKIVDSQGGRLSNVLEAFDKAIEAEPDVINASFGLLSPSTSLEIMMEEAYEKGIVVVAAAGNNNSSKGFYPASYDTTIAVASLTTSKEAMEKSNYGNWVDVAAVGQAVLSALPNGEYGYKSGTSQSAVLISSRVAMMMQEESYWTFENVMQALKNRSSRMSSGKLAGVAIVE